MGGSMVESQWFFDIRKGGSCWHEDLADNYTIGARIVPKGPLPARNCYPSHLGGWIWGRGEGEL